MRKVAIIGIGLTKFGNHWEKNAINLAVEAGTNAIHDAGIHKKEVQAIYGGIMSGGLFNNQEHFASLFSDYLGFKNIPSVRVESACA
ncbi:MAG: thiolase domain-containing protein, partial [Candidatus Woesearchaeota archaeon]